MLLLLKYKIKYYIVSLFSYVNKFVKHQENKILIYDANSDKVDNTAALFDYLIDNGFNKKYQIVLCTRDFKELKKKEPHVNVIYADKISCIYHFMTSRFVFYRADWLKIKPNGNQQVIQMWHGSPIKKDDNSTLDYEVNPYFTGFLSASEHFDSIYSEVFRVPKERMIRCGHPRTDDLFKPSPNYDFGNYKKLIIWTPTYRKRQQQVYASGKQVANDDIILPLIPVERFDDVNSFLKEKGVKVVVKLHPLQSLEHYNLTELDHFVLLSHQEFLSRGMSLYPLLKQSDAMITDYSSIYWDYLVLDRPIGFTEDDIDGYANGRGFIMDDPEKFKPGPKLKTIEDFFRFVDDLVNRIDNFKNQRKEINTYGNPITDGHSCQRALEAVGINI